MKKKAVPTLTWSQRLREGLAALNPRLLGRDLAGALAGGSSRDGLPVRLSNRTYAGTRNVAVRELGFEMDEGEFNRVFEEFKALADKKKELFDGDIEALVMRSESEAVGPWSLQSPRALSKLTLTRLKRRNP